MTTLFVNACMRGEASRTLALCREYLERFDDVVEVDVAALDLKPFDADRVAYRTEKQRAGEWDDPIFSLSRQFAEADDIVIGVPYWDLSFPAAFKTYLEHVSVCELTFHYTEDARCEGICKAKRITYITTCGGFVEGANFGYEYIVGIAKMFVIPEVRFVAAEGWTSWASTSRSRWTRLVPRWRNSIERVRQNLCRTNGFSSVRFSHRGSMTACPSSRYPLWCSALSTAWILDLSTTGCGWPRCSMPCWKRRA